jgi:hypothetical protein
MPWSSEMELGRERLPRRQLEKVYRDLKPYANPNLPKATSVAENTYICAIFVSSVSSLLNRSSKSHLLMNLIREVVYKTSREETFFKTSREEIPRRDSPESLFLPNIMKWTTYQKLDLTSFNIPLSLTIIRSDHSKKAKALSTTTMKSSSPSQTESTDVPPTTLSDIMLQALSSDEESPVVLQIAMTNTSPESKAIQERRLLLTILDFATELLDSDDFDAIESSTTHHWPPQ